MDKKSIKKMITKEELMEGGFAYPRFFLEKKVWLIFRVHCIQNDLNVDTAIRRLIVRYCIYNNLIQKDYPEDLTIGLIRKKINNDPNTLRRNGEKVKTMPVIR